MKFVEITYRYGGRPPGKRELPRDAAAARARLDEGNRAFASLIANLNRERGEARRVVHVDPRDLGLASGRPTAPRQRPHAAVLGCSDARVPIELIFNQGPNDLFVVRVAGNVLGDDVLGSLRYAVDHLGDNLKLVLVLGHSGCGALTSAVDVFLDPTGYLPLASVHTLRELLDRLLIVVHASARRLASAYGPDVASKPGYRQALIETAIVTNAALASYAVRAALANAPEIGAAYGVYLIDKHEIWAPRAESTAWSGLAEPPRDAGEFTRFGDAVVRSQRITTMLAGR